MKKIIPALAAIAATSFACSDIETYDFEIPAGYVAPTHFTDDNGETYITSAAISSASGTIDDYEYVDLGLSVKWARVNIGATSPEEFGDYYAWGETETKDEYTQDNSLTYGDDDIEDFSGSKKYDAATANWGNAWRMPSQDEFQELIDNCQTIEYLKYNNVYGYLLTIDDGKSLFFPEAGYNSNNSGFYYWTSTPYNSNSAYRFGMSSSNSQRYLGCTIRAVTDGDSTDKSIEEILGEAPEQLYLVGLNDDWDSYDIKLTPSNDDNAYEYQGIAAVSSCSSGYAIYVEEDNDFRTFSSDTGKDDGALVYQGSENLPFSNTGLYIWTVDLANFTYSYTKVTSVSYSGLNNSSTLVAMTQDTDNQFIYTAEIEITTASTDGIKIVFNGNSDYYLGGTNGDLEFLSTITNDEYLASGTYTLTIDFSEMTYSFVNEDGDDVTCTINGYEFVDLGLPSGLKWATVNIGATSPKAYGNYYRWSEITIFEQNYTKNNNVSKLSITDISGNETYDAATANWGEPWRMPTYTEFQELIDECTWTLTTQTYSNGSKVYGKQVTGPNGYSIFLPAAGGKAPSVSGYKTSGDGEWACYWTSTSNDLSGYLIAYVMYYEINDNPYMGSASSTPGYPIRPVAY